MRKHEAGFANQLNQNTAREAATPPWWGSLLLLKNLHSWFARFLRRAF